MSYLGNKWKLLWLFLEKSSFVYVLTLLLCLTSLIFSLSWHGIMLVLGTDVFLAVSFIVRITSTAIYILYNKCNKVSAVTCTCENVQVTFHAWSKNRWLFSFSTFGPGSFLFLFVFVCLPHGWKHTTPHMTASWVLQGFFCPINIKDMQQTWKYLQAIQPLAALYSRGVICTNK